VIGSIRRECLDHIVILNQRHLRRVLSSYVDYSNTRALIFRSTRIARTRVQFSRAESEGSSRFRKSVARITATNGSPPDSPLIPAQQSLRRGPYSLL
jgi:hypothetical protein